MTEELINKMADGVYRISLQSMQVSHPLKIFPPIRRRQKRPHVLDELVASQHDSADCEIERTPWLQFKAGFYKSDIFLSIREIGKSCGGVNPAKQ